MSVFGNARTRVRCMVIVDGVPGSTQEVEVGDDCAVGFHNITIMWSKQLIIWMYDNQVLRVLSRDMLSPFPLSTTMFLYASLYDTSPYPYAWQAGYLRSSALSLSATYAAPTALAPTPSLNFNLPLDPLLGAPLETRPKGRVMGRGAMWPVAIDYCSTHVETQRGYQSIRFDGTGCGGRFHSTLRYFSGTFSALYQCPRGNASGLVSSFYVSVLGLLPLFVSLSPSLFERLGNTYAEFKANPLLTLLYPHHPPHAPLPTCAAILGGGESVSGRDRLRVAGQEPPRRAIPSLLTQLKIHPLYPLLPTHPRRSPCAQLSSEEGSRFQDEIDFEWLGKNHRAVQTNFYVNGGGGREVLVPLPFDCSDAYHNYTLSWTREKIRWYVDGALVREALSSQSDAYPVKPMYVYGSMWNASWVVNGGWSGAYSGVDVPYFAKYKDIRIGTA
ncbi:unnamed protein product [Closterium sp. NIES-53]